MTTILVDIGPSASVGKKNSCSTLCLKTFEGLRETSMKLRKSLVESVMQQNILSCSVLPPKIVRHDAFIVILLTSADICVVVHDDLG